MNSVGLGRPRGQPVCTVPRSSARVSVAAIAAARLVCVTLELQAPQQHGEGDRIAVRCRAGAVAVARISSLPQS
jgi:hypothetical protein